MEEWFIPVTTRIKFFNIQVELEVGFPDLHQRIL